MRVDVITIFPELFGDFLSTSLIGRACREGILEVRLWDLREFTKDRHRTVDDAPYGGGAGMVMTAQPWLEAVRSVDPEHRGRRVLMSPQGHTLNDAKVQVLAKRERLVLLCGRYEGIDERVCDQVVDEELSIGDYVLSGGELAAMVVIEALSRQIPGVVGDPESVKNDSFRTGLLDYPHYTRPPVVEGLEAPEVLLSGDHAQIERYRRGRALEATRRKRPDLLDCGVSSTSAGTEFGRSQMSTTGNSEESPLKAGLVSERSYSVTAEMSPPHLPVEVLSTPAMIGLIEGTCLELTQPLLREGETTVGVHVSVSHTGPAVAGEEVLIKATLQEVRERKLLFEVEVSSPRGTISTGTHRRAVVDSSRFG